MRLEKRGNVRFILKKEMKTGRPFTMTILSFKRDRKLIIRKEEQSLTVAEDGFEHILWKNLDNENVLKFVEKRIEKEFPRSHNLYIKTE